jgi:hypothetical protein
VHESVTAAFNIDGEMVCVRNYHEWAEANKGLFVS